MLKIFTLLIAATIVGSSTASSLEDEKTIKTNTYEKGTITLNNGKTKDGYIYIDHLNPQKHQNGLIYIDEKTYGQWKKGKKIKKSLNTLKVKEVTSFKLDNGKEFRRVRYANLLATKKTDMLPKKYLLEVVADGKITVYKKCYKSQGVVSKGLADAKREGTESYLSWMLDNFEVLMHKDKERDPTNLRSSNLKKLFGDNETVLANYNKNHYGFQKEFTERHYYDSNVQTVTLIPLLKLLEDYNK